jgi:predicted transcriptional regulator
MPKPNGKFIRCTRIEAGLMPGDLAELAKVRPATLYNIESVDQPTRLEVLHRIARVLEVDDVNKLIASDVASEPADVA